MSADPNARSETPDEVEERMRAEWAALCEDPIPVSPEPDRSSTRVLDQDDIDRLLGFDEQPDREDTGLYALANSALVVYERLPQLELLLVRLLQESTTSFRGLLDDNVEFSLDQIAHVRFGDYLNSIPLPAMLAVIEFVEWRRQALLVIDSALIYSLVDVSFGGRRGTAAMRIEGRPYTKVERRVVQHYMEQFCQDLMRAMAPVAPVTLRFVRMETNPRFTISVGRLSEVVVLSKLRVDLEDRGGRIEVVLPMASLEPVRDRLTEPFLLEPDPLWTAHLSREARKALVDLDIIVGQTELSLSAVLALKPGDRIPLPVKVDAERDIRCGDRLVARGVPTENAGWQQIHVTKPLLGA